ncbi:zinc finger protein 576, tandem duplicate 1 [Gouania willdenowi]|uniref:Uncharacterized LOC114477668 n=1 Tax=Gouania willdenowi TaxID=441366 RepID=A0A8C5G445_GOUWI|nr:uncharacterized protein LOC114477668 [Gouania willdenowi]XP_028325940.1 uncharacterized protein LOC114477668 [Gouania willdenowi]
MAKGTKQQKPTQIQKPKPAKLPMFKKKKQTKKVQKEQAKSQKGEKTKADLVEEERGERVDILNSHLTQDCLLLLKGHKQPQLKVYKLDPSKASGQAPDPMTHELQTNTQSDGKQQNHPIGESLALGKKKGGRTKTNHKALSLLSSLKNSCKTPETPTTKPKTTRKRKSSSKLEIEGIITSSKRSLDCKECGEMFSDVSSLQKHKTTTHVVESPSLTYTNGNIFEGVSNVNLYQLPKSPRQCVGVMSTATDWDTEPEIAMEDREQNLSFPALIPSPSLTIPPAILQSNCFDDTGGPATDTNQQSHTSPELDLSTVKTQNTLLNSPPQLSLNSSSKTSESVKTKELVSPVDEKLEQRSAIKLTSVSEVVAAIDDDLKEELLLDVNLVTVGEKTEDEDSTCDGVSIPQNKSNEFECDSREQGPAKDQPVQSLASQTVSCSINRVEVKEEEEELLVQRKKVRGKRAVKDKEPGGMRRGKKSLRKDVATKQALIGNSDKEMNSEKKHGECRVVFEKHPAILGSDQETDANNTTATLLPSTSSACDCSHDEEQVVFELKSVTTSVHEVMNKSGLPGGEEHNRASDQSPLITLEKFLASRQRVSAETEPEIMTKGHHKQRLVSMDEDGGLALQNTQVTSVSTQHHQDIRTVLVKEETSIIPEDVQNTNGSKHIKWNVEPISNEDTDIPGMESPEITRESRITPEFSSSQCIFYPVKVEEREMQVEVTHAHKGRVNPEASPDPNQVEHHNALCHTHEGSPPALEYQDSRVQGLLSDPTDSDYTNNQDFEPSPNLREFLLQSSDEEDGGGLELYDPQINSEAEIMAYFNQNQTNSSNLPDQTSSKKPIDYFCKYFGWDTWVEIAEYTDRASRISNPVTPNEVAHFVGIHIAMGTLKFPCSKLYWEDLTKVPLIAEAMALPRFLELSHKLKLNSPASVSAPRNAANCPNAVQGKASPSRYCKKLLGDQTNETAALQSQTDPLWKIQPLLLRFKAGCQSLRQEDHYAIDHYPLHLTGRMHSNQISLYCTSLIGFSGSLSRVELTLNFADKENAVKKMVSKGTMVFLCKQELSTPAMLEHLLAAGVNGAGMVGGSRGQVGDEFVSSDGRLMLRRSHRGFILSTAGSSLKSMTSLIDNFEKAQMLARLNKGLQNLYTTPFTASTPTCWPQAVLWYLTDLALVNSWLQYRQEIGTKSVPLTLMAFRLEVSKALIFSGSDTQDSVPPHSPTEPVHARNETSNPVMTEGSPLPDAATRYDGSDHWPEQLGEGEGGRCRFGDCQRMSRVLCLKCCVFLCISRNHNCFLNFHSQRSLEKK